MSIMDAFKEGTKLIQASDNIELFKNFIDIQTSYMEMVDELEKCRTYIKELEKKLENKEKLNLNKSGYYEKENSDIKYCSRCFEVDNKMVSMVESEEATAIYYKCTNCNTKIVKEKKKIPVAQVVVGKRNFDWNR